MSEHGRSIRARVMNIATVRGMLASLPLLPPTLLWGAAFGAAASAKGVVPQASVAFSAATWSGTAQMGVLTLLSRPLPVIFATSLLLSLRFVPMSLALGSLLDVSSRWRHALAACLIGDASFALVARLGRASFGYLAGTWVTQWTIWILGTAFGTLVTPLVPSRTLSTASDALVAAIFGYLVVEVCPDRKRGLAAFAFGAAALITSWALSR